MPYEPPPDATTARRSAIGRWVSFALAVILVGLVAYLGYVGFQGSAQVAEPPTPSRDCRTPGMAPYGWVYEAINYDAASDAALADLPDPDNCPGPGAPAGQRLQTTDGVEVAGWYIPAGNGAGPTGPTVVLAHGHGANKSTMLGHAAVLHDDYNVVIFDFRNHGQSGGSQTTGGVAEQADLRAVVDWIDAKKEPEQIAVLGSSMGGAASLNEAVSDQNVDALILDSTHATLASALQARLESGGFPLSLPGSWSILLGSLLRTGQDISAADPVQHIGLFDRPVLIIVGGQDASIGDQDGQDLLAAAEAGGTPAELKVCADAGHGGPLETCRGDYRDWVLGFLARSLAQ
jgi:pimeloyl-ACP methyl ester carboxylesterase